jgi:DNA-directed RNA polymerase delta subunit
VDLSQSSRRIWETLLSRNLTPPAVGKFTKHAWDYYARLILSNPKFDFLLLCDDSEWKLREWAQKNYSGWALLRGVRTKRKRNTKAKQTSESILDDENLIQMDSDNDNSDQATSKDMGNDGDDSDDNADEDDIPKDKSNNETPAPSTKSVSKVFS